MVGPIMDSGMGTPFISYQKLISGRNCLQLLRNILLITVLMAFHFGCEGSLKQVNYLLKVSWSQNYGTYWTTDEEQSTDIPDPGAYGIFGEQEQLSTYLELNSRT